MNKSLGIDKYLTVARRIMDRYTVNGKLILAKGDEQSKYSRLEWMAAKKYLGV